MPHTRSSPASAARTRASEALGVAWSSGAGRAFPARMPDVGALLVAWLGEEVERRRLFPWIAVAFGVGVLLFFAAEGSPSLWAPVAGFGLATAIAVALRHRVWGLAAAIGCAALFAGFAAGVLRLRAVEVPLVERITVAKLSGFLEEAEMRGQGARLTLRIHAIEGIAPERLPRRVRVTVREARGLAAGDFLEGRARILPLPEAARPGGYDFARDAYFKGLGGIGSLLGPPRRVAPPGPPDWDLRIAALVDRARNEATQRIAGVIGGQAGAVAAALVTGKRGLIEEETNDALRAAGIYHIVSISGLHMVLAAGTIFWLVRGALALSAAAALRLACKKIAAACGMAGASAYCLFSGAEVATVRSLIMILVMLGAVLVDRPAVTLRNLAVAALIVMALEPETILGPSFQMSFAAVGALVAAGEWWSRRRPPTEPGGLMRRAGRWLLGAAIGLLSTTLVAGIATAPFASFHFQAANPYGMLGNALALPLVSLVVMPAAVLGMLAYPFGLDRWVWELMGFAVDGVLRSAAAVAELDGSALVTAAFGPGALGLMTLGLVIAVLIGSPLRWLGFVPALSGLWLSTIPDKPELYVDREGAGAAVRTADGRLAIAGKPSAFVMAQWLRADGDAREPDDPTLRGGTRCDPLGCVVSLPDGRAVAYVADRRAFPEDCRRAAIMITRLRAPPDCAAPLILDRAFLDRHGATSVIFRDGRPEIATVRAPDRTRPWLTGPPQARPIAPRPNASPPRQQPPAEIPDEEPEAVLGEP
ncbi:ComEC/Rec2 family competence protein [Salinarimonas soli]|uniref:ComEC family competence protein n=1 Tax=Salinarimonas soli TaxID=1638099 RepID=A0A5B2W0I7_9HYPH|nr:ComEC/Rec2 family competence protein [Salinarimonas soli]KAA2243927.1 ComEC family competence protein [Salinarimonas soli]